MKHCLNPPMLAWAARDLGRRPWRHLATAAVLFGITLLLGSSLLVRQALVATSAHLMAHSPAIVVRRAAPTGWIPLPMADALTAVDAIPGALDPQVRLWGNGRISGQPVTIVAWGAPLDKTGPALDLNLPRLHTGEVIVGGGLTALAEAGSLRFDMAPRKRFTIVRQLPATLAMAAHDAVLMHPDDVRALLDIPPGHASDLTIEVFHEEAITALSRDLANAFPWPVQVSTRTSVIGRQAANQGRRATLVALVYVPALLALVVLGLAEALDSEHRRAQVGLLRALGWTGQDFLRLSLWRWACLCIPSVGLGLTTAYALTYSPGVRWLGPLLLGWTTPAPPLYLSAAGAALIMVQVAALTALPYLATVVAVGLRHATSDPHALMTEAAL